MVGVLFHVDIFCHDGEIRFDERTHLNLSLGFELSHLWIVVETMHVHEVVVQTDVSDSLVVHERLESYCAKVRQVHRALHIDLTVAPAKIQKIISNCRVEYVFKFED